MTRMAVGLETVGERLSSLDERLRSLQDSTARDAAATLEGQSHLAAMQNTLSAAVAQQATAHAVLAQWMRDWTAEVTAWKSVVEARVETASARQETMTQELSQARGALRVAMWVFGTALTVVTGVFSGVMVRALGELMARAPR